MPEAGRAGTDAALGRGRSGVTAEQVRHETRAVCRAAAPASSTATSGALGKLRRQPGALHRPLKKHKLDDRHPYILLDSNKCILCGRCVRYCGELIGVHALGFINRGYETVVKPALDKPLRETTCVTCGNCIEVCPTGAITSSESG